MPESGEYDYLGFQRRLREFKAARARAGGILDVPEGADHEARRQFLLVRAAYELLAHGTLSPPLAGDDAGANPERPKGKYNLDSQWGHFLWWREKFFGK